jgi:hypothetical protein
MTESMLTNVAVLLIIIAVLAIVILVANSLIVKRRFKDIPASLIFKKTRIRNTLQEAMDLNATFEMCVVSQDNTTGEYLPGRLEEMDRSTVTLGLRKSVHPDKHWVGWKVEVFFRTSRSARQRDQYGKGRQYFKFSSEIIGVKRTPDGEVFITLPFPSRLEMGQKRACLRIEPPPQLVLGFRLWPVSFQDRKNVVTNLEELGIPLINTKGEARRDAFLSDISGGGIRIERRPRRGADAQDHVFKFGKLYIVRLELLDPVSKTKHGYHLVAKVVNSFEDMVSGRNVVGLQFVAIGSRHSEDRNVVDWVPLRGASVPDIENWVVKRDVEMTRTQKENQRDHETRNQGG